jgi:hypothetical protein
MKARRTAGARLLEAVPECEVDGGEGEPWYLLIVAAPGKQE